MLDFSDMEEGTRKLYRMKDDWLYIDEVTPVIVGVDNGLTVREQEIDKWWAEYAPNIADRIIPFVKNVMSRETDTNLPFREVFFNALGQLAEG